MAVLSKTKQKGDEGELSVIKYLLGHGKEIITRNYCSRYGEIDIICKDENYIIFVEVKTRKRNSMIKGFEAVNLNKRVRIIKTSYIYLQENNFDLQPRFDVAEVKCGNKGAVIGINYISNAFGAEEVYAFF